MSDSKTQMIDRLGRRRYLVPNAVTLANMFCGYLCIIYAFTDRFHKAFIAILIAIVLDGLDGRVARGLKATSKFGTEFDSFSDFISFGVAPALLMYNWCFRATADEFGVVVCFAYALCAAGRLARFNIAESQLSQPTSSSFVGLPTPAAAVCIAALVNYASGSIKELQWVTLGTVVMLGLAALMVSQIPFYSVKNLKLSSTSKWHTIFLGIGIAGLWYDPYNGLLILALIYVLSGPFGAVCKRARA